MSSPQATILGMIDALRSRWLRRELLFMGAAGLAGVLSWLLVMTLVDNLAMLSSGALIAGWLAGGALACGWLLLAVSRLVLGRPSAVRLALLYESRVAGQSNRLVNSVEFIELGAAARDPLAFAAVLENARALDRRTLPQAIDFRPVHRTLLILVALGAVLLGYGVLRPQWMSNALRRVFAPLAPPAHLLATEPRVSPGDVELIEGAPLTIEARVPRPLVGSAPEQVYLEYRPLELEWTRRAMTRVDDGVFRCVFDAVRHPLTYRVRARRCVSPAYAVTLRYCPRIEQLQVSLRAPAYAGGVERRLEPGVGDVTGLEGSTIEVRLTASAPLSKGQIDLSGGAAVRLEIGGEGRRAAVGRFGLLRSGTYALRLTDEHGLENLDPPRYTLTAEPDEPPLAAVTSPARDLVLPADAEVELVLEAQDDIGLSRLELQARRGTEDWAPLRQWTVSQPLTRRHAERFGLSLAELGLKADDVLLYRLVAWDNRQPTASAGIGRTWSITVAEPSAGRTLLGAEARRLLEALKRILELQQENRSALDLDRAVEPIRARQQQVRDLTLALIAEQRRALRPPEGVLRELEGLADDQMLKAIELLADYGGPYRQRVKHKRPILDLMDAIIGRLQALIGSVDRALQAAEQAQRALEQLSPEERDQALQRIHDLLAKLRDFLPEQDRVIEETEELARKGGDFTAGEIENIERLKGTEDAWAEVFTDSVRDIAKLTEQGFADATIANDYKEMVEQIEAASLNLTPELIVQAVPREQAGRELAESLVEEMEMWLPNSPDHVRWIMEEPLDFPEIPLVELPDQLWDLVGDLIEEQDALNDAAEDVTSAWADSLAEGAGWEVAGGPISNFSAVGKTGNQLPDDNELSGRSGDGRSGRSQGQLVENVAKGLPGRPTPTRVTNDPYEEGVVRELQQMAVGGATGGGKARGAGQEGLQGQSPPPLVENMHFMIDWQQRIRQKAERVVGQLQVVRLSLPSLDRAAELMRQAEAAGQDGRYAELFKLQQMVLQNLRLSGDLELRELALNIDRASSMPPEQRRRILDALEEPVPPEYEEAVRRYFEQLSVSE